MKADLLMRLDRFDEAIESLDSVLQLDPENGHVRAHLSLLHMLDDNHEVAGKLLVEASAKTWECSDMHIQKGRLVLREADLARDGTEDYRITANSTNGTKYTNATEKNIHRMINANRMPIKDSMARGWVDMGATYNMYQGRKALAWDETSGRSITGVDYSMMWWVSGSGWGFYGWSSNPFFTPTLYYQENVQYWILPPGVPDF